MTFNHLKKYFFLLFLAVFFIYRSALATEYDQLINKVFEDRKLDVLEGIWVKVFANQGPTGCVTMFFNTEKKLYHQVHIDSCFVMEKVTGRQVKSSEKNYKGENAVYFFDGTVNWGPSEIKVSEDNNLIHVTHISPNNTFTERWKRIWPKDIVKYNQSLED